jgi:hypothetical protein
MFNCLYIPVYHYFENARSFVHLLSASKLVKSYSFGVFLLGKFVEYDHFLPPSMGGGGGRLLVLASMTTSF